MPAEEANDAEDRQRVDDVDGKMDAGCLTGLFVRVPVAVVLFVRTRNTFRARCEQGGDRHTTRSGRFRAVQGCSRTMVCS